MQYSWQDEHLITINMDESIWDDRSGNIYSGSAAGPRLYRVLPSEAQQTYHCRFLGIMSGFRLTVYELGLSVVIKDCIRIRRCKNVKPFWFGFTRLFRFLCSKGFMEILLFFLSVRQFKHISFLLFLGYLFNLLMI